MRSLAISICLFAVSVNVAHAQNASKTLASTLEVYAFPKDGQEADQQSKDEAACYDWATSNTGSDPFQLQKEGKETQQQTEEQVKQAQQATQGAGAGGAVKGAAAGALIGEISHGDTSESAAIGAAVGLISSRRHARRASAHAQEEAVSQGASEQQATQEQIDNFKKAFSACLEAKDYLVKY